jgi:hypothetical protein
MKTDFNSNVWYLNHRGEKVETTLADYLNEFWSDETTSPSGVRPRLHIREETDEETGETTFELWTYGVNGNNPRKLETFETEKEAENWILEYRYEKYLNSFSDSPVIFYSEQEIDEFIDENLKTENE